MLPILVVGPDRSGASLFTGPGVRRVVAERWPGMAVYLRTRAPDE